MGGVGAVVSELGCAGEEGVWVVGGGGGLGKAVSGGGGGEDGGVRLVLGGGVIWGAMGALSVGSRI